VKFLTLPVSLPRLLWLVSKVVAPATFSGARFLPNKRVGHLKQPQGFLAFVRDGNPHSRLRVIKSLL
jgi:hypothetical protein